MNWKFWQPKVVYVDRPMSEAEISEKMVEFLGDLTAVEIAPEGVKQIFKALRNIDGLPDYLRDTMAADIKRYFAATTDKEREIIRGAFSRTAYLRAQLLDDKE